MIISKTASRNVAFKASRMSGFVMVIASQGQVNIRNLKDEGSDSRDDNNYDIHINNDLLTNTYYIYCEEILKISPEEQSIRLE